jgi:Na+/melibiose symporter-like transporter
MFRVCNSIVPGVLFLIIGIIMFGLWLNKQTTQQVADELAERRRKFAAGASGPS